MYACSMEINDALFSQFPALLTQTDLNADMYLRTLGDWGVNVIKKLIFAKKLAKLVAFLTHKTLSVHNKNHNTALRKKSLLSNSLKTSMYVLIKTRVQVTV
jgi:hypothetical protein